MKSKLKNLQGFYYGMSKEKPHMFALEWRWLSQLIAHLPIISMSRKCKIVCWLIDHGFGDGQDFKLR